MSRQPPSPIASKVSSRQVNLSTGQKFFWGKPKQQLIDIFRKPIDNFERLSERARTRNRQTQTTIDDPAFKILEQDEKWSLIQLADGTFGWVTNSEIKCIKDLNYWEKIKLAPREKLVEIALPREQKIHKFLAEFEGVPYLWGGTTKAGMDCSAFVQKLILKVGGILLPRNSREQKKCGQLVQSTTQPFYLPAGRQAHLSSRQPELSTRCPVDNPNCPLDILFFVHLPTGRQARSTRRHHVGFCFENLIWHFCLDQKGLTSEPLESIKKRYDHIETRRIFKFKNA